MPEKGLFEHQLIAWRDAFCAITAPESRDAKLALRELQTRHEGLQRELRRKEKALAQAAALRLSDTERQAALALLNSDEFKELPPSQIVQRLADAQSPSRGGASSI